jgi:hypothetical protein
MDETEMDDLIWEAFQWETPIFTQESLEQPKRKRKAADKPSKSKGEPTRQTVRKPTSKSSTKSKKI